MTGRHPRRGAALLLALMVVILLEGIAAFTLSAAFSRARLVAATRDAVEGRAVAGHALAVTRVGEEATLGTLADGDSVTLTTASPLAAWQVRVEATRLGATIRLRATATRTASDGRSAASQRATLFLQWNGADTLRVISR